MGKWLLVVESNSKDPAQEAEFNEWYDTVHIPDVLETEGIVRATRYELVSPVEGKGKFLAAYEIEADDLEAVLARHQSNMKQKEAQGRISSLIASTSRGIYKQISRFTE